MSYSTLAVVTTLAGSCLLMFGCVHRAAAADPAYLSLSALAASSDGKHLFVACTTSRQIAVLDLHSQQVSRRMALPGEPSGLVVSASSARLYVTCSADP
jgi:DNA-binding beta-propeller fold protein YncE